MSCVRTLVACAAGLLVCLAACGCTGSGWIKAVPVRFNKLSPTESLDARYDADACCHWIDARGNLCVAMSAGGSPPPDGDARRSTSVSMVLGPPPASTGQTYRVMRDTMRMTARDGSSHVRCASLSGIVTAWYDGSGCLHGRFRLFAKQQQFHIMMGWYGDLRQLMYGEFVAVPDAVRGARVLGRTELNGMERTAGNDRTPVTVGGPGQGETEAGDRGRGRS
ncbi:MAG: hypothetical protein HOP29_10765 [Phycisphaerales bacterium]|nr:hypothetical protein [Phycisphaerales bacterium]